MPGTGHAAPGSPATHDYRPATVKPPDVLTFVERSVDRATAVRRRAPKRDRADQ